MAAVKPESVRERLDGVVRAMHGSGTWDVVRPADEAFRDMGAFGMRSMAFAQWLRWVFVPNVEALIAAGGPFPDSSEVSVQAMREGDTDPRIAALCPALQSFDELFGGDSEPPSGPASDPPEAEGTTRAREWLARAESLLAEGRFAEARAAAEAAVAEDADCPNAENFAGWVLMQDPQRTAADLAAAAEHFRRAHVRDPYEVTPIVNLGDALLAAGRASDAVDELSRISDDVRGAAADNWLGWHFLRKAPDLERALIHLGRAAERAPGWGVCRLNRALALDQKGDVDGAYAEYGAALEAGDAYDEPLAHARRSLIEEQKGWLRNALRSMRRAKRAEKKRQGARLTGYAQAAERLEAALRERGVLPPAERRDEQNQAWERECDRELPIELTLGRTESGAPMPDQLVQVAKLLREGRFEEAVLALREAAQADYGLLVDGIGIARHGADEARAAGHAREALELMRMVCDGYRAYASWATSGAEGHGRMYDLEQATAELARWERELR